MFGLICFIHWFWHSDWKPEKRIQEADKEKQTRKQFIGFPSWTSYKQLYCLRNSLNVLTYTSNDAYVIITNYLNQLSSLSSSFIQILYFCDILLQQKI